MPFLDTPGLAPEAPASDAPPAPVEPAVPSWSTTFGAAFRTGNSIGSALSAETLGVDGSRVEDGYSPWDDIKGTKYEPYWSSFQNSANSRYSSALKQQIDREDDDRRTLSASGWRGTLTGLAAGVLDPVLFVPVGGEAAAAGKGAWAIGKGALAGARTAGAATALQEAALHASQETRTGAESVENVGANVVLGSLLGGAFGALSHGEARAADKGLGAVYRGEGVPTLEEISTGAPTAAGAETARQFTTGELTVKGKATAAIAAATKWISPNMRSNFRAVPEVRQVAQQLSENTLYQMMHEAGESVGPAVETSMRVAVDSRLSTATEAHNQAFAEMKKAGVNMSRQDFEERVGQAMRTEDRDPSNPYVSKAAQAWRSKVFDPFKEDAINMGLLPPDVDPKTAASYFHRVWNRDKLIAQEPQFKAEVTEHYNGVLGEAYGAEHSRLQQRLSNYEQRISDLRSSPEERANLMQQLHEEGDKLDANNPEALNHWNEVNELRQQAREAKEAGNAERSAELSKQAAAHYKAGGEMLQGYLRQRTALRSRMQAVDNSVGGLLERTDGVLQSLVKNEEANRKSLNRLVQKGQKLQKEMQRLDPEKYQERLSEFKESFAKLAEESEKQLEKFNQQRAKLTEEAKPEPEPKRPEVVQREPELKSPPSGSGFENVRRPERNTKSADIPDWFEGVDKAIGDLSEKFGMAIRPKLWVGSREGAYHNGVSISNGHIVLASDLDHAQALRIALHEFGHQADVQLFKRADAATRIEIHAAWKRSTFGKGSWSLTNEQAKPLTGEGLHLGRGDPISSYNQKFNEWFAEQVSRFVTTKEAPTGVVEKFFHKVSEHWKAIYQRVTGHVPLQPEMEKFLAEHWHGDDLEKAVEAIKTPEQIDAGRAAAMLSKHMEAQQRFAQRMNSLSQRIENMESLTPEAAMAEVHAGVDKLLEQVNGLSLARGERQGRLKERMASLDPAKLESQIDGIKAARAQSIREFYDKWEIARGGQGVDHANPTRPDFTTAAREIADQVHDHLTGNTGGSAAHPDFFTPITRGPLKDRTFKMPDAKVGQWLENNIVHVGRRYARTMAGEVELTRRFGRADMRDQFERIKNSYSDLRDKVGKTTTAEEAKALIGQRQGVSEALAVWSRGQGVDEVTKEHVLQFLRHDEAGARTDLEGLRDLVRGTYRQSENSGNWGRISRGVMGFNYVRMMGNFLAANIAQIYRPAMVHGLSAYMQQGVAPLMRNLGAIVRSEPHGLTGMIEEAKLAGIGVERILHNRMATMAEMGDPYARQTALERMLENATNIASRWNGMSAFFDLGRTLSSVMTQHRIIDGAMNGKDTPYLGWLGISKNAGMTGRIAEQFQAHGETIDGLHTANTEQWTDPEAVRAFRAALSKEAAATLHAKSVGDTPLWSHTPTGRLFFQFRTFNLAAHQRIMLRGMQESPARFTGGLVAMTSFGMLGAYLTALRAGHDRFQQFEEDVRNNPLHLLAEGLDKSGMFTLPFEVANRVEDFTKGMGRVTGQSRFSFNPIKTPIEALGRAATGGTVPDIHGDATDPLSALLGPSGALPGQIALAAGGLGAQIRGAGASKKQTRAQAGLVPFQSYGGMKEIMQAIQGNSTLTPH